MTGAQVHQRLHPSVCWEICEKSRKQGASGQNGNGCVEQEGGAIISSFIPGKRAVSLRQCVFAALLYDISYTAWDRKFKKFVLNK